MFLHASPGTRWGIHRDPQRQSTPRQRPLQNTRVCPEDGCCKAPGLALPAHSCSSACAPSHRADPSLTAVPASWLFPPARDYLKPWMFSLFLYGVSPITTRQAARGQGLLPICPSGSLLSSQRPASGQATGLVQQQLSSPAISELGGSGHILTLPKSHLHPF